MSVSTRSRTRRTRLAPARVTAVLLALVAALLLMGIVDLFTLPGWVDPRFEWEVPLEAAGSFFTFFLAGAYGWIALFPRAPWPALVQLGLSALALMVSAAAGTDGRPLVVGLGVGVSAAALWLLVGRPAVVVGRRPSAHRPALAVAALGLPLWLPYALEAFDRSRAGVLGSVTQGVEHWPVQGATGLAVVLGSLALALWDEGRPLLRAAVSLSAVYIGMAELAYPDRAGAMGDLPWGVGVTLWGLLVALVVVPRHGAPASPATPLTRTGALPRGG